MLTVPRERSTISPDRTNLSGMLSWTMLTLFSTAGDSGPRRCKREAFWLRKRWEQGHRMAILESRHVGHRMYRGGLWRRLARMLDLRCLPYDEGWENLVLRVQHITYSHSWPIHNPPSFSISDTPWPYQQHNTKTTSTKEKGQKK